MLRGSTWLGLTFAERTVTCAEISGGKGAPSVGHVATFSTDVPLEQAETWGKALAAFLKLQKFGASRAVVGVPAKWLVAVERDVPPAAEEQGKAILRLAADRMSVGDDGELVTDFAGEIDRKNATRVLLVGILRKQLNKVVAAVKAAGLDVVAVTPTTMALLSADVPPEKALSVLVLGRGSAEFVLRDHGSPRMLRHIAIGAAVGDAGIVSVGALAPELRRAVAMTSPSLGNGSTNGSNGATGRTVELWDTIGLSEDQRDDLGRRLGMTLRSGGPGATNGATDNAHLTAIALATTAARGALPLNFLDSRLTVAPPRRFSNRSIWITSIVAVVVLGLAGLYIDILQRESELADLQSKLTSMDKDVKEAQINIAHVAYGRSYLDMRPATLAVLREVTSAFRDDEPIWLTSFSLRDGRIGQISGKATENRYVLAVFDRLAKNPHLSQLNSGGYSASGSKTVEQAFSISFVYSPTTPTTQPAGGAK